MAEAAVALAACRSCCVVSVCAAGGGAAQGGRSGSGVVLSRGAGAVLCHGALFAPFLEQAERPGGPRTALLGRSLPAHLQIRVLLQPHGQGPAGPWQREGGAAVAVQGNALGGGAAAAELVVLAPCRPFQEALARVFGAAEQWRFGPQEEEAAAEGGGEADEELRLLHWFALLRLRGGAAGGAAGWLSCVPAALVSKGQAVVACGSPFGALCPDLFLNCLSRGVVSNAAGERNALLLTDARCLPGTEGGGVFALHGPGARLLAVVVAPLCWKAGQWVGLTLLCAADCVLRSLRAALAHQRPAPHACLPPAPPAPAPAAAAAPPVRHMLAAVVLVECGLAWGSGVLLRPRLVLTCRHVVSGASAGRVRIQRHGPHSHQMLVTKGKVVFATQDASPYDIALIELEDSLSMFVEPVLASKFYEGDDVSMVGYGAFGQACGPSITSGILSAVITVEEKPVMLQATCAVHGGSSGGALFATHSGKLLGIVASNTRDNSIGATYPHLNFSIPITVLQPALLEYTRSGGLCGFEDLDRVADRVRVVWRLQKEPGEVPLSKL